MRAAAAIPVIALLLYATLSSAAISEAEVADLLASCDGKQVFVSYDLRNAFDERMQERIASGLPTEFTFQFDLLRARKGWFNRRLESTQLQVVAVHEAVSREYQISYKLNGELVDSRIVQQVEDLERAMTHFESFPVFRFDEAAPERRLRLKVRAELGPRTILSFIPSTITTDWTESNAFRAMPEKP